jgi:hypothetical protein
MTRPAASAQTPSSSLSKAKERAAIATAAGRSPEDLEGEAWRLLAASLAERRRRSGPEDPHEIEHLVNMFLVAERSECRPARCSLAVVRYGDRFSLRLERQDPSLIWEADPNLVAAARSPEDLEREAGHLLVSAYIMAEQRRGLTDTHLKRHLLGTVEVGNSGRCRAPHCVLSVRRVGPQYSLGLDIPWDENESDFRMN